MYVRDLAGKEIIGEGGMVIGKAKDLVFDTTSWQVQAVEATLAKNVAEEFGMKRILRTSDIQIKVGDVKAVGDKITLKISKSELQTLVNAASDVKTVEQEA